MESADPVQELTQLMARLRSATGCPWDREQTHNSLKRYLVEETAELLDAIDGGDDGRLADELGDVLLQVAFHCQLAAEAGRFDLPEVARRLNAKLRRRHPHVFGDATVADAAGVVRQWDAIKKTEGTAPPTTGALDGVPRALPALAQAEQLQRRAAKLGFDWPTTAGVLAKLDEELAELRQAMAGADRQRLAAELGDLLFTIVNLARFLKTDPEDALRAANRRFRSRFAHVEARVNASGRPFAEQRLEELDAYWNDAKQQER